MTTPTLDSLRNRAEAIHRQYDAHFAGQPRISRDPALLDSMIVEVDEALADAKLIAGKVSGTDEVVERLTTNRAMYTKEAAAVREAQSGGPEAFEAHRLGTWASLAFDQYRRHFAGQSRSTRDLGLLGELVEHLETLDAATASLSARAGTISGLSETRASITDNIKLYRTERGAIVQARGAGTLDEQAGTLASVANAQFDLYRVHFAGKSRTSRRPGLLARMIASLEAVGDRMRALKAQGLHDEGNAKNAEIVAGRLTAWRTELEAIRSQKQKASLQEIVSALGTAANDVFAAYREGFAGKDRTTRELSKLTEIQDQLLELGRQMDDLDRVRDDQANQHNLMIVLDHLRLYQREYGMIRDVQKPQ